MPKKKDDYSLFDYSCDLNHRVIWLGSHTETVEEGESGVDAHLAERAIKSIYLLDKLGAGDKPIDILINNPGGDLYHANAIYDSIKTCKNYVTATVYGAAMSAATIILQAADKRVMMPSSRFMIHYGERGTHGSPKTSYNWTEEHKKIDAWMERIYLYRIREKHPDFKLKELQKLLNFDTILSAEETVELGLADEVSNEDVSVE